ncbi:hypothetical protein WR25_09502 [Diploscapter pachys]|uniref:Metallo-beta-lactamase domain-containing protein 1 n=1 Tax=Diploscapter pachys TaxID=2018661 RepID=A0A2A2J3D5_9BILA|nr:hypothetical protein WR25_09502 [Diploscapter pachys]
MFIKRRESRLESSLPSLPSLSSLSSLPSMSRASLSSPSPPLPPIITALSDEDEDLFVRKSAIAAHTHTHTPIKRLQFASSEWKSMDEKSNTKSRSKNRDDESASESSAISSYENKMKELSSQLSQVIQQMSREDNLVKDGGDLRQDRARIIVIRNGSAEQTSDGAYEFVSTITLIEDDGKRILVDTGLGTDINGRRSILEGLLTHGITPPAIDIVITTHGHPDHFGTHDYPDAIHFSSFYIHHKARFNLSSLFDRDWHTLAKNVALFKASGHTSNDIAVFVDNEQKMGRTVISGKFI